MEQLPLGNMKTVTNLGIEIHVGLLSYCIARFANFPPCPRWHAEDKLLWRLRGRMLIEGPARIVVVASSGPGAVMAIAQSARIHPTAVVSAEADLGEDVQVGPYVVIEGEVRIGAGCVLRPGAHLIGPLTMGCHNTVFSGAVLGEQPQHLRYAGEPTRLVIGDYNIIREHVTIHRGTTHSWETRIGNYNFLMAHSHIAHDCRIGNHCIITNGALLAGHCVLEDNVYLSGNCALHQFVRVGR